MYKIFHKIFGWDYIAWKNSLDQGVSRVFLAGDGNVCFWQYRAIKVIKVIKDPNDVIWLTCSPQKYFPLIFTSKENPVKIKVEIANQ